MILYGLKTCDTCRKAMKVLDTATFRDVRTDGVPVPLLSRALEQFGAELVNRRSTTWRGLTPEQRAQPAQALLQEHPSLMKRPLIVQGDEMWLGWGGEVQTALSGRG